MALLPVILSGGIGARLWPLSREAWPKPFIRLPDGQTLLEKCLNRLAVLPDIHDFLTVTNERYLFPSREVHSQSSARHLQGHFLLEPEGRNTAPAICLAALWAIERDADATLLVLPADHYIDDARSWAADIQRAQVIAQSGQLVTFGIPPKAPATGFGYIHAKAVEQGKFEVVDFTEKPSLEIAQSFLEAGDYFWNSGMFCFRAEVILSALEALAQDVYLPVKEVWDNVRVDQLTTHLDPDLYAGVASRSIDYAVMEKASNVSMIAAGFDWSDLGDWASVSDLIDPDMEGNQISSDQVLAIETSGSFIQADGRVVAAIGIDNLLIVDTPDALLVARRDRAQLVGQIVEHLKASKNSAYLEHKSLVRPWGSFTVLGEGAGFKVKKLTLKPGASISLQYHHHRSEHWVVVQGKAMVLNDQTQQLIEANQSTFIAPKAIHRVSNPGHEECIIVEVQVGSYLGEDDIVRLEDRYGRPLGQA